MNIPNVTVIVPVYNRQEELRRALASVKNQSYTNFECIVVDDCSTVPIAAIVTEMADNRFVYARNYKNGGPYNARFFGYKMMKGDFLIHLDSDDQLYPWALTQAVYYLDKNKDVDAVAGMNLRDNDSTLFARVRDGERVVTPKDYLQMEQTCDCVGVVRKKVVEEWLLKRDDYYAMEFHQWFTFGLKHNQLYVDEPWAKCYVDGQDRVSNTNKYRHSEDSMKFLEEHDTYIRKIDAPVLARMLFHMWVQMVRNGRRNDRKIIEEYLSAKKIPLWGMVIKKVYNKILCLFRQKKDTRNDVQYI